MYQALTSLLSDMARWLQSASQVVPIYQLSLITWLMFLISGSFGSKKAFKVSEQ